jgi:hypothetical protein
MAWNRPKKIGKWDPASAISAHPVAIERSTSAEQRDSGKEFVTICRLFYFRKRIFLLVDDGTRRLETQ